jgi:23S rRNA (cytosine1962-C5)-methyltransferase
MRIALGSFSKNRHVLNMFSYTGGFSLHALAAGAASCTSVDVDKKALSILDQAVAKSSFDGAHTSVCEDAFAFLESHDLSNYDLVILDPPAFAKKRAHIKNASTGYKKLMKLALHGMKEGGLLYVASCSYFMDELTFERLLQQAAFETKRVLKLVSTQLEALDHPRLFSHKEGSYLKGFLVQVFKT